MGVERGAGIYMNYLNSPRSSTQFKSVAWSILEQARKYTINGFSVVPVRHGEKFPAVEWKEFQTRIATDQELKEWFPTDDTHGLGIVCGKISGNLICLDFNSLEAYEEFLTDPDCEKLAESAAVACSARGHHLFFRATAETYSRELLLRGIEIAKIDLLAEGRMVVIPPTLHPDGPVRQWQTPIDSNLPIVCPENILLERGTTYKQLF